MIKDWLDRFKDGWVSKDVNLVLELFTDNVEYWETPHNMLIGVSDLRREWGTILEQQDLKLEFEVFSSVDNRFSVMWDLSYKKEGHNTSHWAGVYLIELDSDGKCSYFYQVGESDKLK